MQNKGDLKKPKVDDVVISIKPVISNDLSFDFDHILWPIRRAFADFEHIASNQ